MVVVDATGTQSRVETSKEVATNPTGIQTVVVDATGIQSRVVV